MLVAADVNSKSVVVVTATAEGELSDGIPPNLAPGTFASLAEQQGEFLERVTQHLNNVGATCVVLTDVNLSKGTPSNIRAQSYLEAGLILAAHQVGAEIAMVHQQSIATHLGLPASSSKHAIRETVASSVGESSLSPDPIRRARAIGALWSVAGTRGGAAT